MKIDWEVELGVMIGHRFQDGSTQSMHFGVAVVISHLSQFMSLYPGDII